MKSVSLSKTVGAFPGKELGVALFVSVLWHLVCIFSITIVSLPPRVKFPRFSEVSFVGAMLSEPDFEIHLSQLPFSRRPNEVTQPFLERSGRLVGNPLPNPAFWTSSRASATELFLHERSLPLFFPEYFELPREKEGFVLEGPARQRVLYYRPERPRLPRWADPREIRTDLQFKFWISPEGKTESVETLVSSGDPTVDLIGMRYLRQWRFNPKREGTEWGTVSFSLPPPEAGKAP